MKRIIICIVLLGICIFISIFAHFRVEKVNSDFNIRIDALITELKSENTEKITQHAQSLNEFWEEEEHILVHFIRHSYIDTVTTSMARLPALAAYGDYSEVLAELYNVRRQMKHVCDSEQVTFENLL